MLEDKILSYIYELPFPVSVTELSLKFEENEDTVLETLKELENKKKIVRLNKSKKHPLWGQV